MLLSVNVHRKKTKQNIKHTQNNPKPTNQAKPNPNQTNTLENRYLIDFTGTEKIIESHNLGVLDPAYYLLN